MSESFVDLSYRGLALGRRIKLTQVRPMSGYLEVPAPMPVGSKVAIATDDGVALDAVVTAIHEQVGGSERVPGMIVAPVLAGDAAKWWHARVTLPEEDRPAPMPTRSRPVTLRPRSQTMQTPPPPEATEVTAPPAAPHVEDAPTVITPELSVPDAIDDDGKKTVVMEAIDPALLELMTRTGEQPALDDAELRRRDSHEVIDDGRRTTIMESVDLSALGLDPAAVTNGAHGAADDSKPTGSGAVKKRRKKR